MGKMSILVRVGTTTYVELREHYNHGYGDAIG